MFCTGSGILYPDLPHQYYEYFITTVIYGLGGRILVVLEVFHGAINVTWRTFVTFWLTIYLIIE
jgi:hypothetical protein